MAPRPRCSEAAIVRCLCCGGPWAGRRGRVTPSFTLLSARILGCAWGWGPIERALREVRAWHSAVALTSYHEDVRPALRAMVKSLGTGPFLSGLWFGDSQPLGPSLPDAAKSPVAPHPHMQPHTSSLTRRLVRLRLSAIQLAGQAGERSGSSGCAWSISHLLERRGWAGGSHRGAVT